MYHKLDFISSNSAVASEEVGLKERNNYDYAQPFDGDQRISTTRGKDKQEKVFFTVLDVTDGRRYKVFLRPSDISRLKISKVRKTISSASGKPPFSFDLLLGETVLLGAENDNCAALGITPHSVLLMKPTVESREEKVELSPPSAENADGAKSEEMQEVNRTGTFSALPMETVLEDLSDATAGIPFAVSLNERQRALQAQLFEEAKHSRIFLALGSSVSGAADEQQCSKNNVDNQKTNESGFFPSLCAQTEEAHQLHNVLTNQISGETTSCNDSFAEFIGDIVSKKTASQQNVSGPEQYSDEHHPRLKTHDISNKMAFLQASTGVDKKPMHLKLLLQGERYYDMYSHIADVERSPAQNTFDVNMQTEEKKKKTNSEEGDSVACGKNLRAAENMKAMKQNAEAELPQLVEKLKDDVSDLLALHLRDETVKQALQRDIFALKQRLMVLERTEQEERKQLDVLLSRLRREHCDVNGTPVFTGDELRTALRNMEALQNNELLRQENAALERRLAQEVRRRREMSFMLEDIKGHIRVLVRVRPPFRLLRELSAGVSTVGNEAHMHNAVDESRLIADDKRNTIMITDPHTGGRQFNFYRVFSGNSTQAAVFEEIAPLVQLACDGVNVSVLAYGQTGSGKTYTILGRDKPRGNAAVREHKEGNGSKETVNRHENGNADDEDDGILPRAIRMLFWHLKVEAVTEAAFMRRGHDNENYDEDSFSTYEVACSLVELYNNKVHDLLSPPQIVQPEFHVNDGNAAKQRGPVQVAPQRSVKIGPDGLMCVVGLTQHVIRDAQEALKVFCDGASRRQVHATQLNSSSSRSHLIFTIHLTQRRRIITQQSNSAYTPTLSPALFKTLESKLVFVDLAGSERVAKSQSEGDRLLEARYINKSLSALGDVVASLSSVAPSAAASVHTPYRNSTLTALLQDVIGSRSKTIVLACVSPSDPPYENHIAETISTLKFASRVRCVRNSAPPFLSARADAEKCMASLKPFTVGDMEENIDQQSVSRYAELSGERPWMRSTNSSRQRGNVVSARQNGGKKK